jgi:hypothetical protein|tara:strand:+ start:2240 stop:2608 length:369 start_codon:yes stop_codon:yes gene_type:complete
MSDVPAFTVSSPVSFFTARFDRFPLSALNFASNASSSPSPSFASFASVARATVVDVIDPSRVPRVLPRRVFVFARRPRPSLDAIDVIVVIVVIVVIITTVVVVVCRRRETARPTDRPTRMNE